MSKDKKLYDANFDAIDWGKDRPESPGPQWKEEDFRYDEEWISLLGGVSWSKDV